MRHEGIDPLMYVGERWLPTYGTYEVPHSSKNESSSISDPHTDRTGAPKE
jgi:hypothetical protein